MVWDSSKEETSMPEEKPGVDQRSGILRLLMGIILRPRATLEYLAGHGGRSWWAPCLVAVLFTVLPIVAAAPITVRQTREAVQATQEMMGERAGSGQSAEQEARMEQAMSMAASPLITAVFPSAASVVGLVVAWLAWAGALYLAGTAMGGRSTFRQMVRTVVWTWIPFTLRGLLQTVYILTSGQAIDRPGLSGFVRNGRPVGEMIAAPPGAGQMLAVAFLSRVDLFLVWNLVLIFIGVAVVTRLPRRKAILVGLGVWLLLTAIGLVPAIVGGTVAQQFAGAGGR